jgi:hypothetical protein
MDAASGSKPARGSNGTPLAHGVMLGPLKEVRPDRIVVADRTFFLREGTKCSYPPGTPLQVIYIEHGDGRREAESITLAKQER